MILIPVVSKKCMSLNLVQCKASQLANVCVTEPWCSYLKLEWELSVIDIGLRVSECMVVQIQKIV